MPRHQERFYVEPLRFTDQMREREKHCRDMGIIAPPFLGKGIKCGRKIQIKKTYLWDLIK